MICSPTLACWPSNKAFSKFLHASSLACSKNVSSESAAASSPSNAFCQVSFFAVRSHLFSLILLRIRAMFLNRSRPQSWPCWTRFLVGMVESSSLNCNHATSIPIMSEGVTSNSSKSCTVKSLHLVRIAPCTAAPYSTAHQC